MPVRVIMASPRTVCAPNDSATPFSGWPSKRSRKMSDQATVKPQLAGLSGEIVTPLAARISAHAAVGAEPRPACAAERQHGRAGIDGALPVRRLKQQTAFVIPAGPAVAQLELHAHGVEPPQPRAQQAARP